MANGCDTEPLCIAQSYVTPGLYGYFCYWSAFWARSAQRRLQQDPGDARRGTVVSVSQLWVATLALGSVLTLGRVGR